jgi:hypothetical protein
MTLSSQISKAGDHVTPSCIQGGFHSSTIPLFPIKSSAMLEFGNKFVDSHECLYYILASLCVHTLFRPYLVPTIFAFVFISKVDVFIFVPLLSKISTPGPLLVWPGAHNVAGSIGDHDKH